VFNRTLRMSCVNASVRWGRLVMTSRAVAAMVATIGRMASADPFGSAAS
jgi:hypothetical protein